jgi:glycerophosphoryl diester phosphodiesterase
MKAIHSVLLIFLITFQLFGQDVFNPEDFHQLRFAHRGGYSNEWPENTIKTLVYNITELGAKAIELDIEATKDNRLVAFHDKSLNRLLETTIKPDINQIALSELKSIPLKNHESTFVPTLEEIIDTLLVLSSDYDFVLELDFKPTNEAAIIELMRIVLESELKVGRQVYDYFFISTFYPDVLASIRKKSDLIRLAFAVHSQPNKNKLAAKAAILFAPHFIKKYQCQIIEPNQCMVTGKFVRKFKKRGVLINTYTVNTACERAYIEALDIAYTTNCISGYCEQDFSGQKSKPAKWCKKCQQD